MLPWPSYRHFLLLSMFLFPSILHFFDLFTFLEEGASEETDLFFNFRVELENASNDNSTQKAEVFTEVEDLNAFTNPGPFPDELMKIDNATKIEEEVELSSAEADDVLIEELMRNITKKHNFPEAHPNNSSNDSSPFFQNLYLFLKKLDSKFIRLTQVSTLGVPVFEVLSTVHGSNVEGYQGDLTARQPASNLVFDAFGESSFLDWEENVNKEAFQELEVAEQDFFREKKTFFEGKGQRVKDLANLRSRKSSEHRKVTGERRCRTAEKEDQGKKCTEKLLESAEKENERGEEEGQRAGFFDFPNSFPFVFFDVFLYNGEAEILELRLEILRRLPFLMFVIVESPCTFTGSPKKDGGKLFNPNDPKLRDIGDRVFLFRVSCLLLKEIAVLNDSSQKTRNGALFTESFVRNSLFDAAKHSENILKAFFEISKFFSRKTQKKEFFKGFPDRWEEWGKIVSLHDDEDNTFFKTLHNRERFEFEILRNRTSEVPGDAGVFPTFLDKLEQNGFFEGIQPPRLPLSLLNSSLNSSSPLPPVPPSRSLVLISDVDEIPRLEALWKISQNAQLLHALLTAQELALVLENLRFVYNPLCVGRTLWRAGIRLSSLNFLERIPPSLLRSHKCTDGHPYSDSLVFGARKRFLEVSLLPSQARKKGEARWKDLFGRKNLNVSELNATDQITEIDFFGLFGSLDLRTSKISENFLFFENSSEFRNFFDNEENSKVFNVSDFEFFKNPKKYIKSDGSCAQKNKMIPKGFRRHVLKSSALHLSFFFGLKHIREKYDHYAMTESNWIAKLPKDVFREQISKCHPRQEIAESLNFTNSSRVSPYWDYRTDKLSFPDLQKKLRKSYFEEKNLNFPSSFLLKRIGEKDMDVLANRIPKKRKKKNKKKDQKEKARSNSTFITSTSLPPKLENPELFERFSVSSFFLPFEMIRNLSFWISLQKAKEGNLKYLEPVDDLRAKYGKKERKVNRNFVSKQEKVLAELLKRRKKPRSFNLK